MNFAKVTRGSKLTFWVNLELVLEVHPNVSAAGSVLYFNYMRSDEQAYAIVDQSPEELLGIGKDIP